MDIDLHPPQSEPCTSYVFLCLKYGQLSTSRLFHPKDRHFWTGGTNAVCFLVNGGFMCWNDVKGLIIIQSGGSVTGMVL